MTPEQAGLAISRRIEDEAAACRTDRAWRSNCWPAEDLIPGAGFIFRTAAQGASLDELTQDARALAEIWRCIADKRKSARPPATLYRDLGPIERTMRDVVRGDVARVLIDDAGAAEAARAYCRKAMPGAEARIELATRGLFDRYGLEEEIARLSQPRVALPSGGWITIEATEALTAVDVNSGSFTQSGGLEETSLTVNLEAAAEIGRQIRLRGIGGLIVVDFIHLGEAANIARVLESSGAEPAVRSRARADLADDGIRHCRDHAQAVARAAGPARPACPALPAAAPAARRPPTARRMEILRRVEREARRQPGRRAGRHRRAGGGGLAHPARRGGRPGAAAPGRGTGAVRGGRGVGWRIRCRPSAAAEGCPICGKPETGTLCALLFPALRRHRSGPLAEGRLCHSRQAGRRCGQGPEAPPGQDEVPET